MTLADYLAATPFPVPLEVDELLVGARRALLVSGKVFVSQAMMRLIEGAQDDGDELEQLYQAIPLATFEEMTDAEMALFVNAPKAADFLG